MRIYSWNVNGLRSVIKKGAFDRFLSAHRPDVLCLQEIKADATQVPPVLPTHHAYWHAARTKGYAGTAIFSAPRPESVHAGFVRPVKQAYAFVDAAGKDAAEEGRVLTAEYPAFHLVTVYTPNAKDDLSRLPLRASQWDPAVLAHCQALERSKPVIVCGDLNVAHTELDLANPKANAGNKGFTAEERAGFQAFLDAGFVDTFRMFTQGGGHYSWWSPRADCRGRNIGWRIDYVLVSRRLAPRVVAAAIHADVTGSDHCPVSITLA